MPKKKTVPSPKKIKNQKTKTKPVENGLSQAIMGFTPGGLGVQLSQIDTLFRNNRWYLLSNMRQLLSELYVEHGLIQTICNVPVDDALRGGVMIKTKQLNEEQIEQVRASIDRDDDINKIGQAMKWNRLFGGAGVIIMTDQDPSTPLNLEAIDESTPLEFRAVDMWELFPDQRGEIYDLTLQDYDVEYYDFYGQKLHNSRVMLMKGLIAPSFIRPRLRGWGFSVIEALVRSINQYLKQNDLTFEVLDEFKIDVYRFKDLSATLMAPDAANAVAKRVNFTNQYKNYENAIVMDSDDEYNQKQLSFAGLAEVMREIRIQIAADLRMPISKIFGISSTGFSSGEDDIENYHAMVESEVRARCKYDILKVVEIRCQKLFGFIPDDMSIDFKPLRIMSSEQEENVKTQKFNRLYQARTSGEITSKEFRDACNKENLFGVQLDTAMELNTDDVASEGDGDGEGSNQLDDEGDL